MKKIIIPVLALSLFIFNRCCYADLYNSNSNNLGFVPVYAPSYAQYYDINNQNISAQFKPLTEYDEKRLSGLQKDAYKKAKKIQKYIEENNFQKALKEDSEYLPTHIQYYNHFVSLRDFHSALNEMINIKRINASDKLLNDDIVSYKLGMLLYLNKNYSGALTYLNKFTEQHNPSEDNLWYALADIYLNQGKYAYSISYATKIPKTSMNYIPVQEILYQDYYNIGEVSKAEECADILIKYKPTATNYIRWVEVSSADNNKKIDILNQAKNIAMTNRDDTSLLIADAWIAKFEQNKIDNAVSKLSGFVEKPEWSKISNEIASIIKPPELSQRQERFFKSTNLCMDKYKGDDLKRCFEYVNREEEKLTTKLLEEYRQAYQERLLELDELRRQQQFLQQTYFERLYWDDFFYMKHPYFFGYW